MKRRPSALKYFVYVRFLLAVSVVLTLPASPHADDCEVSFASSRKHQ